MISFDCGILVYAADPAAGERRIRSADLLARAMRRQVCAQALQSLCEFYNVITRKSGVKAADAAELVSAWSAAIRIESAIPEDLDAAMRAVVDHRLPFWDAMLWATVRRAGVQLLISEAFQDGRVLEGTYLDAPGDAALPMSAAELDHKWRSTLNLVVSEKVADDLLREIGEPRRSLVEVIGPVFADLSSPALMPA